MGNHHKGNPLYCIKNYLATAVEQVLVVAFGIIKFCSSVTIATFPYVAPAVAQVLEVAFGNIHVCSCLTVVIFPYVVPAVAQVLEVAFGKIHVFRDSLSSYFLV